MCCYVVFSRACWKMINCRVNAYAIYRQGNGKFSPSNINPNLCTHLSFSIFGVDESGKFQVLDSRLQSDFISKTMALKTINPELNILAVVGGWEQGSETFSRIAASARKRRLFITSALKFITDNGFDGLDIDWEYPAQRDGSPDDKDNFVTLLNETKASLTPLNKSLSITAAAVASLASQSYDIPKINHVVDFINLLTYDFSSHWDQVVGYNAPLNGNGEKNVEAATKYWLKQGASGSKLVLGLAFFGHTFTLSNPEEYGLGAPVSGPGIAGPFTKEKGFMGYNEICLIQSMWHYKWDFQSRVPFLHEYNQLISYDDVRSIKLKVEFSIFSNLRGVMISSIDIDDFLGSCGNKYPLLNAVNNTLFQFSALKN